MEMYVLIIMAHHFSNIFLVVGALFCPICQILPVWFHYTMFPRLCCFRLTTVFENCHSDTLHNISRHRCNRILKWHVWNQFYDPLYSATLSMFHCPVGVWVIEQRAIIVSATVRSPTVRIQVYTFPITLKFDRHLGSISEWCNHYNIQSCGFKSSQDLAVRRLTA